MRDEVGDAKLDRLSRYRLGALHAAIALIGRPAFTAGGLLMSQNDQADIHSPYAG
jgi:hypothetical protein